MAKRNQITTNSADIREAVEAETAKAKVAAMVESRDAHKRQYTQAPVAVDAGVPCSHCGQRYGHKITNTYPNGNRRRLCGSCKKPFVAVRVKDCQSV
jgi:hypothetical protein